MLLQLLLFNLVDTAAAADAVIVVGGEVGGVTITAAMVHFCANSCVAAVAATVAPGPLTAQTTT